MRSIQLYKSLYPGPVIPGMAQYMSATTLGSLRLSLKPIAQRFKPRPHNTNTTVLRSELTALGEKRRPLCPIYLYVPSAMLHHYSLAKRKAAIEGRLLLRRRGAGIEWFIDVNWISFDLDHIDHDRLGKLTISFEAERTTSLYADARPRFGDAYVVEEVGNSNVQYWYALSAFQKTCR